MKVLEYGVYCKSSTAMDLNCGLLFLIFAAPRAKSSISNLSIDTDPNLEKDILLADEPIKSSQALPSVDLFCQHHHLLKVFKHFKKVVFLNLALPLISNDEVTFSSIASHAWNVPSPPTHHFFLFTIFHNHTIINSIQSLSNNHYLSIHSQWPPPHFKIYAHSLILKPKLVYHQSRLRLLYLGCHKPHQSLEISHNLWSWPRHHLCP